MTRSASTVDRLIAAVIGLLLIAIGAGALLWNTTWISRAPDTLTAPALVDATAQPWWPWALAGAGIVLVLAGLRWLFAHTPAAKAGPLPLHQRGGLGVITVDLGALVEAAAGTLAERPDVRSATGKAIIDRGTRTLDLTIHTAAEENLPELTAAIDAVCADLAHATGDTSISTRTIVRIDKSAGASRRVQ